MRIKDNEVKKGARIYFVRSLIAPILMGLLFFICSGSFDQPRAWIYYGMFFILSAMFNGYLLHSNPELLYHRNTFKSDAKGWDKIIMPLAVITAFHLQSITMGLDIRFGGTNISSGSMIFGLVLFVVSYSISSWAMMVNQHFESNVRIQKDRNHAVISTGPYEFIRHPGYLSFILGTIGAALAVGSTFGLINSIIGILLILIRTSKEDKTLQRELEGYVQYSTKVKYRILPGVW